jgi:hypothetical protein
MWMFKLSTHLELGQSQQLTAQPLAVWHASKCGEVVVGQVVGLTLLFLTGAAVAVDTTKLPFLFQRLHRA